MIGKKKKQAAAAAMVKPEMYDIVRRPIITEKATLASEHSKVVFHVADCANKGEVKQAIEALFGVKVEKVNTLNTKGKTKRFRGREGQRSGYKKAVVTLAEGQTIDLAGGVR